MNINCGIVECFFHVVFQALSALDPSPLHELESLLVRKPTAAEAISVLEALKTGADRLAHGVEAHFRDVSPSAPTKQQSVEEETLFHFGESLYQLFRLLLSNKYRALIVQHLSEQFAPTAATKEEEESGEVTELVHSLRQSHSKISSLMESTLSDCVTLTQGCALQLLVEVKSFWSYYFDCK